MSDFLGRKGRTQTWVPLSLGSNITTSQMGVLVDPSAVFFAGMLATIDKTTNLVRVATSTSSDDLPGNVLGVFGDTKIATPVKLAVQEIQIGQSLITDTVKLKHPLVQPLFVGASASFGTIVDITPAIPVPLTNAQIGVIQGAAATDLTHGLLGLIDNAVLAGSGVTAGHTYQITYYYQPVDKVFATGTNEVAPSGAVTIWQNRGTYQCGIFETLNSAGASALPKVNDLLYCSANGRFTVDPPHPGPFGPTTSEPLAICRQAPSFTTKDPFGNYYLILELLR